ncbi:hypothetical protein [Achromobacter ruhlandii]|uniref:hypothetical protein n=1 Tax=Achromobacter ruhlandii TaxID=72557 RepID=UPI0006C30C33|nr:hypothetical protein [Achromobacter ruhlandii]AMG46437.1 hypothetical protein AL520_20470 [Achromobacter xylosoxidans]CUI68097.1 Uncharacterised protein [Achromobacter ruhlandii]CUJ06517.1 Uncharacterised protein [Achromobacter ruhlandii]CUK15598.1 Uncharacterised protein [Achromobacter ruhlandii]
MFPIEILLLMGGMALAVGVAVLVVAIQLLRFIHWGYWADDATHGERPHFTGPLLALAFSLLAASEILPFHPIFDRIHALNPVPPWATEYYVVAMLGLMVLSWVYGCRVKNRLWNGLLGRWRRVRARSVS